MTEDTVYKEETKSFFFDTYALYEIYKGSENYEKYEGCNIITTKLNIFEIFWVIWRDVNCNEAEEFSNIYYDFVRDFDNIVIKEAVKLKKEMNKRNVSMTDCIGYCVSKQLGIKFLTGDKEFEHLENVEFVR